MLENVLLPIGDRLLGRSLMQRLRMLRKERGDRQAQLVKLDKMLKHATQHSSYYRSMGVKAGSDPEESLRRFPILTKQLLRSNREGLLTMPEGKLLRQCSSGTTGFQSIVYWTPDEQSLYRATQLLWWEWAGYRIGDPILQTGITPNRKLVKGIKDRLFNTYYLQAFSHSPGEVRKALEWAAARDNPVLAGYASSLYVLARFALDMGMDVRFKTAVSWGDKLFPHYRSLIEKAFGTKVHETYGSAEGLMMGAQKDLGLMYSMDCNVYMEIVDDHGMPVGEGEMGHVIVTNLNAWGMPLIRYRIGDLARMLPFDRYPENRELDFPIIEKVIGRDTDLIRTPQGRMLVVHSFTGIFEHIPEISQFRIIQDSLEGITIEYVPGEGFSVDLLRKVEQSIRENVQEPFILDFRELREIPPSPSGKPKLIVSNLPAKEF